MVVDGGGGRLLTRGGGGIRRGGVTAGADGCGGVVRQKVARQALDVLEDQVMEVVGEIRSDAPAKSIKRADSATKMAVEEGPPAKPVYSSEDKWDLRLASDPATSLEVPPSLVRWCFVLRSRRRSRPPHS